MHCIHRVLIPSILAVFAAPLLVWWPGSAAQTPSKLSDYDRQVNPLLSRMTLDEKIGQMTQADQEYLKDISDIDTLYLGSLLSGGSSDPKSGNALQDWAEMYRHYQQQARKTRLGIPILYGVDAVHGHSNVLGAVIFPHHIGLGCTRNPALVAQAARITALEVRATGIQWTFAPCVTVPRDERWGRTYEGFSEDPQVVATLAAAEVRGLQGAGLGDPLAVLACAKHFVGDGGTTFEGAYQERGSDRRRPRLDQGDARLSEADLRRIHLPPYVAAVRAGVGSIMPSYSSWNGEKCSGSRRLLTEILKQEIGFEGFLISDYDALDQLPGDYKNQIKQSINAGMDMVMVPKKFRQFIALLKELVSEGQVPMHRIDDAVRRILRVKRALGLLDPGNQEAIHPGLQAQFGSAEHRAVARECVRQSLVLLKNSGRVLPLSKQAARIHVAGESADDMGNQCGGWTIDWQGKSGPVTPGGTTILSAIQKAASPGTRVTFSRDGTGAEGASVGVAVIGETPYAEGRGDRADLNLSLEDAAVVANLKRAGIPVIVILISGRPMIINDVLQNADAFMAAWLPGTEGQGVADVLFGDHQPSGKLSHSWPRSNDQIPINVGDVPYNPLFEFDFGLTYP